MTSKVILSVVGEASSGKSDICGHLVRQWGFWPHYLGQTIRDLAGKPITRQEAPGVLMVLREVFGPDFLLRPVVESPHDRIVVDGNRVPYEYDGLQALGAVTVLLQCEEPERLRRENLKRLARGEPALPDLDSFRATQANDYGNDDPYMPSIEKVTRDPHYIIDTTALTRPQVRQAMDAIVLERLGETPSQQR